jgi:hypothetical protein
MGELCGKPVGGLVVVGIDIQVGNRGVGVSW